MSNAAKKRYLQLKSMGFEGVVKLLLENEEELRQTADKLPTLVKLARTAGYREALRNVVLACEDGKERMLIRWEDAQKEGRELPEAPAAGAAMKHTQEMVLQALDSLGDDQAKKILDERGLL